MNIDLTPYPTPFLLIEWQDLETALNLLAAPEKVERVAETLSAVRTLSLTNPQRAVYTLVGALAWLTDDRACSHPDCPVSLFGDGSDSSPSPA